MTLSFDDPSFEGRESHKSEKGGCKIDCYLVLWLMTVMISLFFW